MHMEQRQKKANKFYSECKIVQIESCAAPINFKVDKVEKPQVVVIGYSIFPDFYYFSLWICCEILNMES